MHSQSFCIPLGLGKTKTFSTPCYAMPLKFYLLRTNQSKNKREKNEMLYLHLKITQELRAFEILNPCFKYNRRRQ